MSQDVLDTSAAGGLVIRGSVMRVASYAIGSALSIISAALLTRYLGPSDFGRYGTVFALVTIVGAITEAGMTALGVREFTVRSGPDRDRLMHHLLGLRLAMTVVGTLVGVAFALVAGYDSQMIAGTVAAGAGLVLSVLAGTLTVPLQSALMFGRVSALELLRQGATTAFLVVLIAAGAGLVPLLGVPIPVGILMLTVTALLVRGQTGVRPQFNLAAWWTLLRETASLALATAVGTLYVYMAIVLLSLISTDDQVGYFNASFRVFIVIVAVSGLFATSALPVLARAARDDEARLGYAIQRLFEVAVIVGMLCALATVLGARVAIGVIAGLPKYEPAVAVLRIQGLAMLASFVLMTWSFALISLRLHRAVLLANGLALVTSLGLTLALAPAHGARGAAWSTLAGETLLAIAYLVGLVRHRSTLRPKFTILAKVIPAALAALAIGLVVPASDLVATLVASGVYLLLVLVLRAVPAELHEFVRKRGLPGS
jgi:O-antigen/teichoic acid export membrane protein